MMSSAPEQPLSKAMVIDKIQHLRQKLIQQLTQVPAHTTSSKTPQARPLDGQFQQEVGKLAVLLQRLERLAHKTPGSSDRRLYQLHNLVDSVEISVVSLTQSRSRVEMSQQIRFAVEQQIITYENPPILRLIVRRFAYAWHSPSTPLKVIHGLIFSFFIIFGGLFTLAIFQYSVSLSHKAVANYVTLQERLKQQILETEIKVKNLEQTEKEAFTNLIERKDKSIPGKEKLIQNLESRILSINANEVVGQQAIVTLENQQSQLQKDVELLTKELSNYRRQYASAQFGLKQLDAEQKRLRQALDQVSKDNQPTKIQYFLAQLFDSDISEILSQMLWVAAAGTLGSIVSILIRVIDQFNGKEYKDRLTPFFLGFFKPVIGATFGVLFLAIYNSEVVSLPFANRVSRTAIITPNNSAGTPAVSSSTTTNSTNGTTATAGNGTIAKWEQSEQRESTQERQEIFFLFAIAFVVGFSERLAKDTIGKIDGSPAGGSSSLDNGTHRSSSPTNTPTE
jgi:hypothetical protein